MKDISREKLFEKLRSNYPKPQHTFKLKSMQQAKHMKNDIYSEKRLHEYEILDNRSILKTAAKM